jgi:hypothetical protein
MLTILVVVVVAAMVLVLVLLAVVVTGIKQESSTEELTSQPPNAISAWVRRLLGVYVRKPSQASALDEDPSGQRLTARNSSLRPRGPTE